MSTCCPQVISDDETKCSNDFGVASLLEPRRGAWRLKNLQQCLVKITFIKENWTYFAWHFKIQKMPCGFAANKRHISKIIIVKNTVYFLSFVANCRSVSQTKQRCFLCSFQSVVLLVAVCVSSRFLQKHIRWSVSAVLVL